ncbi:MAG: hypothetical protein LBI72_06295 [Flavobacteriaceae bacterium]|jgi:hypothetical protein|nr:hypothetical protein [Flavobacteriaceae bacterium]
MEKFVQFQFLIENGVDVISKGEVRKLQRKYGFSDEMYKFLLLLHSNAVNREDDFSTLLTTLNKTTTLHNEVVSTWYTLFDLDDMFNIAERNEDTIFSGYFFVFAKTSNGGEFAEILVGPEKGSIVLIQEYICEGIDSLEEFFEDYSTYDTDYSLLSEEEVVGNLLMLDQSFFQTNTTSFNLFLDKQIGDTDYN